jgi:hypothetical protein
MSSTSSTRTASPDRPHVIADRGPDGRPQAMLCTSGPHTIITAAIAREIIPELLAVLSGHAEPQAETVAS